MTASRLFDLKFIISLVIFFLVSCKNESNGIPESQSTSTIPLGIININPELNNQTIDSIGTSGAWWAQEVGGWQNNNRQRIIDLLFNPKTGIGLSSYRYHIGAGGGLELSDPWKITKSIEAAPGVYSANGDSNAVRILESIYRVGVKNFIAFSYSPPARLTQSGLVTGAADGLSNLRNNKEKDYAQYLTDIVKYLITQKGIPFGWISPVNEPEKKWSSTDGQEGNYYSPEEFKNVILELQNIIVLNNLDLKILIPETAGWYYLPEYWENPTFDNALMVYSFHSNNSTNEQRRSIANYFSNKFPNVKLWMTEWSDKSNNRDYGMESAIRLATTIHNDIKFGNVSSWQYGFAVSKYETNEGLIYVNPGSQLFIETKRLWALGNFSKFIRPGYIHISSEIHGSSLLLETAYISPTKDEIVLVVINPTSKEEDISIEFFGLNWYKTLVFETSEKHDLNMVYKGTTIKSYKFPAKSISTLIVSP